MQERENLLITPMITIATADWELSLCQISQQAVYRHASILILTTSLPSLETRTLGLTVVNPAGQGHWADWEWESQEVAPGGQLQPQPELLLTSLKRSSLLVQPVGLHMRKLRPGEVRE